MKGIRSTQKDVRGLGYLFICFYFKLKKIKLVYVFLQLKKMENINYKGIFVFFKCRWTKITKKQNLTTNVPPNIFLNKNIEFWQP